MEPLGIIQSRGLGDIVIALPIARHYHNQGREIFWPVCAEFLPSLQRSVPWIRWLAIPAQLGNRIYFEGPVERLRAAGCDEYICLYQALGSRPEISDVPWAQVQKFDEFKYTRAGVPFLKKWTLADGCLTRFHEREQSLMKRLNPERRPYALIHLAGSNYRAQVDLGFLSRELVRIEMGEETDSVFDWLLLMENAQALVLIDSVFANLADQLQIAVEKFWIPRSPIFLSPVLGSSWTVLPPPPDSLAARLVIPLPR